VFDINRVGDGTNRAPFFTFSDSLNILPIESEEPLYLFNPIGSKATVCAFTPTPNIIITGHDSGKVALFNIQTGEETEKNERAHSDVVTDLQLSKDGTYCITSSRDKTARIHDTKSLMVIKTYATETPLNSAALASTQPYVRLFLLLRTCNLLVQLYAGPSRRWPNRDVDYYYLPWKIRDAFLA
jgi:translation initiation factor 3 subunit I